MRTSIVRRRPSRRIRWGLEEPQIVKIYSLLGGSTVLLWSYPAPQALRQMPKWTPPLCLPLRIDCGRGENADSSRSVILGLFIGTGQPTPCLLCRRAQGKSIRTSTLRSLLRWNANRLDPLDWT